MQGRHTAAGFVGCGSSSGVMSTWENVLNVCSMHCCFPWAMPWGDMLKKSSDCYVSFAAVTLHRQKAAVRSCEITLTNKALPALFVFPYRTVESI